MMYILCIFEVFRARQHLRSLAPVMNDEWWWWWPNDIRRPWGLKASWHLCYRWGKTPKKPRPGKLSRPGIEPEPAAWQALMLPPVPQRWPHKGMECLLGWGINSIPGPPPRQHEHERRYTSFTHSVILTGWILKDDYDGQMIFGDLLDLKLIDICLIGEEKLRTNFNQETCSDRGSNPTGTHLPNSHSTLSNKTGISSTMNVVFLAIFSLHIWRRACNPAWDHPNS